MRERINQRIRHSSLQLNPIPESPLGRNFKVKPRQVRLVGRLCPITGMPSHEIILQKTKVFLAMRLSLSIVLMRSR